MQYQNLCAIVSVLIFYLVSIALIRRINLHDPQFFTCLYRYLRYFADYYPSNAFYPGKIDKPRSDFN